MSAARRLDEEEYYTDQFGNPISKYEHARLRNIERNREIMSALGIDSAVANLASFNPQHVARPKRSRPKTDTPPIDRRGLMRASQKGRSSLADVDHSDDEEWDRHILTSAAAQKFWRDNSSKTFNFLPPSLPPAHHVQNVEPGYVDPEVDHLNTLTRGLSFLDTVDQEKLPNIPYIYSHYPHPETYADTLLRGPRSHPYA